MKWLGPVVGAHILCKDMSCIHISCKELLSFFASFYYFFGHVEVGSHQVWHIGRHLQRTNERNSTLIDNKDSFLLFILLYYSLYFSFLLLLKEWERQGQDGVGGLIQQQRSQPYDLITEMEDGFLDLYSMEYSLTFAHLKHISKMKTTSQCNQDTCPNGHKDHFLSEFAVANSEEANAASIEAKFKGYMSKCKAKFPPSDFLGHTNYSIDYGNKTPANDSAVRRYCNGNRVYKPCIFMSKNPWIIWFSIENISAIEAIFLPLKQ